jgi:haloalkane dehalogenase
LFGQVTRAQGAFSPRSHHVQFSLDYIAENLEAPTTVLHYPSRRELIRELERGYDVVGISFVLATFHRMREIAALVRRHAPGARIVLGGYGTVLSDEVLRPLADDICREEGVAFMRQLLGEPALAMPYRHPLIVNPLRLFGRHVSSTGMVFAGLGCPSGCDFCCTSHFFKRKHVRLLPTGADIYRVVEQYLAIDPDLSIHIMDEDFLLNRRRALEFRDAVQRGGKPLSVFAFASVRALSKYTIEEVLEMGIDGLWIGYEGTRSGYAKQEGRPVEELIPELRRHGVTVLTSMIVGFPYQTPAIIEEELAGLLALRPTFTQFMIYGPTPGTPFWEKVMKEGLLHEQLAADPVAYSRKASGFRAMVHHPHMSAAEIEAAQDRCFEQEFARLGPSIYRCLEVWLDGYEALRHSPSAFLRAKADCFARDLRKAYPAFLAGRVLAPASSRPFIAQLQARLHAALGAPTFGERAMSVAALGMAIGTKATLKIDRLQHPRLIRRVWRQDAALVDRLDEARHRAPAAASG